MRVVSLIILAAALASACGSRAASGSPDGSYDRIEELRAARAIQADHRYDPIEDLRAARQVSQVSPGGYVWDDSYDKVEATRLHRGK